MRFGRQPSEYGREIKKDSHRIISVAILVVVVLIKLYQFLMVVAAFN